MELAAKLTYFLSLVSRPCDHVHQSRYVYVVMTMTPQKGEEGVKELHKLKQENYEAEELHARITMVTPWFDLFESADDDDLLLLECASLRNEREDEQILF